MAINRVKGLVVLIAIMAVGAIFVSSASANSIGRCADHHVNTGQELYEAWKVEGVTSLAVPIVQSAGYRHIDGDLRSWMKDRVVKMKTAQAANFVDFGCHPGEIFGAGTITFEKGTTIMAALPAKYDMSDYCGIKPHKGCKRVVTTACAVGKVNCSNPLEGCAKLVFYVKKHHKARHHKKHKRHRRPNCSAQGKVNVNGNCVVQTTAPQTSRQECEANVSGQLGSQCTVVQVQVNANCSNVNVGSEGDVNQGGNCNNGGEETCVGQDNCNTTPPPCNSCTPPPCECKPPAEAPKVELETINDIEVNEETQICATVIAPSGDNLTVTFLSEYGTFKNSGKGSPLTGTNKYCGTYTAPTELPTNATHCDKIRVIVQDNTTGKNAEDAKQALIVPERF